MSRNRTFLIILVALIVTATVFATRVYELSILQQQRVVTVVRPGFQLFHKETNGFNLHYPIGWVYQPLVDTQDLASGNFLNGTGVLQFYFEVPYTGRGFTLNYTGQQAYFAKKGSFELSPVVIVTTTMYRTNDPTTPVKFGIYRPCTLISSSSPCIPASTGGFMAGTWQRGKASPILSERNQSAQTGVLFSMLPDDQEREGHMISQFRSMLSDFSFNNPGLRPSSTLMRWKYYRDQGAYEMNYPPDFSMAENQDLSFQYMSTGTSFSFPSHFTTGTNLVEAKILVGPVLPSYAGDTCLPENSLSTPPEPVTVGSSTYYKSVGAGAAAGNRFDTVTYAFRKFDRCYNISLFLHSTVLENYPANLRPKAFDQQRVINLFGEILATFSYQ